MTEATRRCPACLTEAGVRAGRLREHGTRMGDRCVLGSRAYAAEAVVYPRPSTYRPEHRRK